MILAKKVRLYPTEMQEKKLWQSAGTARFIYNWTLARQEDNYKNGGKFIQDGILRKEITQLKKNELSWLYEVSNNVSKQAVKDACDSYKRFFKGLSSKPKFKSKKKSKPSFYNDNCKLKSKEGKFVFIEKIGWMKTNEQVPVSIKYSNPRVSFDGKYWFLSFGIDKEFQKEKLTEETIGIDVGIKDLAICSNGMTFKNINKAKKIRQLKKKLKRKQKKISRKYEKNKHGKQFIKTNNIIKLEKEIKLLYRKLTNIRSNHIHQTTNAIVKTKPSRIVMETLNIQGMMKNRHLSKAIAEQCLYDFKTKIKYKCEKYGIEFIEADKWYPSSKMCSCCGHINKDLKLSDRVYKCSCGLVIDRDLNAAINLANYKLA